MFGYLQIEYTYSAKIFNQTLVRKVIPISKKKKHPRL